MTPRPEVRLYVRNQSSRNGTKPRLICLHSTEGANLPGIRDLQGLGEYFDRASVQASSHAANDAEGNDARFVPDSRKAWTCAGYNPVSLNLEQIGLSVQSEWPKAQLENTAEWIAYWSRLHDIPIQRGKVADGAVVKAGVVMHSELGVYGGNHGDPGGAYPIAEVIAQALAISPQRDPRKLKVWQQHLVEARATLKSVLALRAKLRQQNLESSLRYAQTGEQLSATRTIIEQLKRLIGGNP